MLSVQIGCMLSVLIILSVVSQLSYVSCLGVRPVATESVYCHLFLAGRPDRPIVICLLFVVTYFHRACRCAGAQIGQFPSVYCLL
jgi:hypothetical protein